MRTIRVLDTAPLVRRGVVVLELDTPSPLVGITMGMRVALVWRDGSRAAVEVKSLGFASSTPDHAHIIVSAPPREPSAPERDFAGVDRIELE